MTSSQYRQIEAWFRCRPAAYRLLRLFNRFLPLVFYIAYPLALLWLLFTGDARLFACCAVPACAFLACTLLRHGLNRPRPYEVWNIRPLIVKDKAGHSFPSRHMACAGVITLTFWYLCPPLGRVFAGLAVLIAACRVLAGIHFTKDVLAGGLLGAIFGYVGFFVL